MHNPPAQPRAIIYIPPAVDVEGWQRHGYRHCARRGYDVAALLIDPDGNGWRDVVRMVVAGEAEVVVVYDLTALPKDRVPRLEEVGTERTGDIPADRLRPRAPRRPGG